MGDGYIPPSASAGLQQYPRDRALDAAMDHSDRLRQPGPYGLAFYTGFRDGAIFMHQFLSNEDTE